MKKKSALAALSLILSTGLVAGVAAPGAVAQEPAAAQVTAEVSEAGKATIKRDSYGVPHVYADTTRDLFYGYGYAVAEDRMFQLEMAKRAVLGTSAEVLGPDYVEIDKRSRASFDPEAIKAQIEALPQEDRDILEGYAAGFNERVGEVMANQEELLPKQFTDYGFEPTTWSGYDVAMIWVGTMANRFSDSAGELSNLQVLQQLTAEYGAEQGQLLFDQLQWTEDPTAPTTVPREDKKHPNKLAVDSPSQLSDLAEVSPELEDNGLASMKQFGGGDWPAVKPEASNLWIVGDKKSKEKGSILLNGPQFSWFNPSYVYGIGLHGAGFDVTGNTPFAHPTILFGTNKDISWGSTAGPLDVNDVYQEQLNPENPHEYRYDGEWRPMDVRTEKIEVAGQEPVEHQVYSTVHGYVTSFDAANNTAYSKKRSWAGTEIQSFMAWIKIMKAQNWEEYLEQAEKVGITINWYYADKEGNIGYVSPGKLPVRAEGHDPRLPAVGDGSMEWEGIRPFSENPKVYNPKQGYIVNWNNQSAAGFNAGSGNWSPVDRVNEIIERLEEKQKFTTDEIWDINEETSFADLNIRYFRPFLEEAVKTLPAKDSLVQDVRLLTEWDGQRRDGDDDGDLDGPQAAIMNTWLPILFETVLKDDLPASVFENYAQGSGLARPANGSKLVYNALLGEDAGVEQSVDFFNGADKQQVLLDTYRQALAQLAAEQGADRSAWSVPAPQHEFSYKNFIGVPQANAEENLTGPDYMNRGTQNDIVSLFGSEASMCTVAPPGQSGFIAPDGTKSEHYADQLQMYADFECKTENLYPQQLEANLESTTVLK
ncbi:penicillin acylase family protein [Arthrobacter crystallopoietes]|uniref:Penicillin amidase n=1 Tax=Crystallibacter crystallopoietes TaxID=37928 RepID=A0A1H1AEB0_9MICC|nr:penicillin acylase family protein [Arthrobacter crystallopoietes]AUI51561.1 penicillin amidase [Arthrobacter crystallopoietes]SDQ38043.1 penicillin amidase [Arthrobacter crystallopoietes]